MLPEEIVVLSIEEGNLNKMKMLAFTYLKDITSKISEEKVNLTGGWIIPQQ